MSAPNLLTLPAFVDDGLFRVVIESPRGSIIKLKYDPEHAVMTLSRPLVAGLSYPYDWGFVPSTRGPDGDPVDVFVMWDGVSFPGVVLPCRPLGVLRVEQSNPASGKRERNDRVAAIPTTAPRLDAVQSVFDVGERIRLELEQFFLASVAFEGKELSLLGWAGPTDALALINASRDKQVAMDEHDDELDRAVEDARNEGPARIR